MRKRLVDLGRSDSMTLEQARRRARLYFGTAADGKDPRSNIDQMRATPTVRELAESYINGHAKLKKKTWKTDEAYLNQLFIPKFGAHLASSIIRADIASVHTDIGKKHPYSANRFISIVRKMYNVGRQLGMVPEEIRNPGIEIVPFPEKKRRRYVTLAEMPLLAAAIDARSADNPYIICGDIPGEPLVYLDAMWRRIRRRTGFHDLRIHDLRRTVGSWLVRDGASLHLVGAVLNHKDQKTTAGYAYFQTEDRQRALDRHGQAVVQVVQNGARRLTDGTPAAGTREGEASGLPRVHRISRKDLYELIWSEPMTTLAQRFGISDVGLAKVCRRSDIPAPPRGFLGRKLLPAILSYDRTCRSERTLVPGRLCFE